MIRKSERLGFQNLNDFVFAKLIKIQINLLPFLQLTSSSGVIIGLGDMVDGCTIKQQRKEEGIAGN